jgi:hypothetical protein
VVAEQRFYEDVLAGAKRSAPAALRNREPITAVLGEWLPAEGLVLEIASGSGEHVVHFARAFPDLEWQPSDVDEGALHSIAAWREEAGLANIRPPIRLDTRDAEWGVGECAAIFSANMVHISPWASALGLLDGAVVLLPVGGSLILYGPWLKDGIEAAPSNLAFDADLKRRSPEWGLRRVGDFSAEAAARGLALSTTRPMPANNLMLHYIRNGHILSG